MGSRPVTVLVTGFGPFPGFPFNPTSALSRWVDDALVRPPKGVTLIAQTVETSWDAVRAFADGPLQELSPDVVLHFGVSARAKGFQIETVARNAASNGADCSGATYPYPNLVRGTPASRRATLNAQKLANSLRHRGLVASTSCDAGTYLCNMLFYLTLQGHKTNQDLSLGGFIHVPPFKPGRFGREELRKGVEILIERSAGQFRHAVLAEKHGKSH